MKRLFSEKGPTDHSLLLDKDRAPSDKFQNYFTKVATLVPSEIIAGYIAMMGLVPLIEILDGKLVNWIIFALCLVLTPIYFGIQAKPHDPTFRHISISTLAFVVWAYATTGGKLMPGAYDEALASIILIAFSLVSGLIPLPEKGHGDS